MPIQSDIRAEQGLYAGIGLNRYGDLGIELMGKKYRMGSDMCADIENALWFSSDFSNKIQLFFFIEISRSDDILDVICLAIK